MSTIEKSIEVNVPVSTAYDQWTQFEQFPRFMEGVEEVRQLDDKRLHWRAQIAGKQEEWDAEIVEQEPDQRIAWRSTSGVQNNGAVTFEPIDVNRTRVTLRLDYQPGSFIEKAGDALGFVSSRVEGDLKRFKEFIESRGAETGAWRGEIHGGQVERGDTAGLGTGVAGAATAGVAGAADYDTTTGAGIPADQDFTGSPVADRDLTGATTDVGAALTTERDLTGTPTDRDLTGGTVTDRDLAGGTTDVGAGTTADRDLTGGAPGSAAGTTTDYDLTNRDFAVAGTTSERDLVDRTPGGDVGTGTVTDRDLVGGTPADRDIGGGVTGGDVGAGTPTDRGLYAGTTDIGAGTTSDQSLGSTPTGRASGGETAGGGTPDRDLEDLIAERELPGDPHRAGTTGGAGKAADQDLAGGSTGGGGGTSTMGTDVGGGTTDRSRM